MKDVLKKTQIINFAFSATKQNNLKIYLIWTKMKMKNKTEQNYNR